MRSGKYVSSVSNCRKIFQRLESSHYRYFVRLHEFGQSDGCAGERVYAWNYLLFDCLAMHDPDLPGAKDIKKNLPALYWGVGIGFIRGQQQRILGSAALSCRRDISSD